MKYVDISKSELIKYMPATINWIEALEATLKSEEIILRATDHAYESLRFYCSHPEIETLINNYIRTHCCLCGSTDEIQLGEYDAHASNAMLNSFCGKCYAYRQGIYELIKYNITHCIKADINPKARIKSIPGIISYSRVNDITFDNQSNNIITHNRERAYLIGVDLGIRDKNDERAYDGDIVICESQDGRLFGGMLLDNASYNPRSHRERFIVCHGYGNFPTPLSLAKVFTIIGNIGECSSFDGFGPSEGAFEQWLLENREKFDTYFD